MSQGKPVILCVDDEENSLLLRKLVLQRSGYEVVTANSGKRALEILQSQTPDILLSDLLMPEMSGAELARQVKDLYPKLPVILISGVNEIPPEAMCADLFMNKVEGPAKLCENIATLLRKHSAGEARNSSSNTRSPDTSSKDAEQNMPPLDDAAAT